MPNRIPQKPQFGHAYRPQKLSKAVRNNENDARFTADFLSSRSCSLRMRESAPERVRANTNRTTNHLSAASLLPLLAMSIVTSCAKGATTTGHRGASQISSQIPSHIPSEASFRAASQASSQPFSSAFNQARTLTPHPTVSDRSAHQDARQYQPHASAASAVPVPPQPAGDSFFADVIQMALHAPADPCAGSSGAWPLAGASARSFGLLNEAWKIATNRRREEATAAKERSDREIVFYEKFEFNPFFDTFTVFIDEALGLLFEQHGLASSTMHHNVRGEYSDVRPVNAPFSQLRPTQAKAIPYAGEWTIKEIAAGVPFYEIEKNAGSLTAHRQDITYSWPDDIPLHLQKLLTNGWLWDAFMQFIAIRLTSGTIYDEAQKAIKAMLTHQFSVRYTGPPEQSDAKLNDFLNNCRQVKYKRTTVAGMVMAPPEQANTQGVLYFMDNDLAPIIVTDTTFRLDDPRIREAVKNGLPIKKVAELGKTIFDKHWSFPPLHAPWSPSLAFAHPGKAVDIVWHAALEKMFADMDVTVLSSGEKAAMFGLGMIKTTMKAMLVVGAPPAGAVLSLGGGVFSTFPDVGMSLIADDTNISEEHLRNFFVGIAIEMVGMGFFLLHKAIIITQAAKTARRLKTKFFVREDEEKKLTDWVTNFKTFMGLPPREKFSYLAQNVVAEPSGGLAQRLIHDAKSWEFIVRLEFRAGLINAEQLEQLLKATSVKYFSIFLGSAPAIITSREQFMALPRCSRIGIVTPHGELRHTLGKLDNGVAIGYKNDIFRTNLNGVEALDLGNALNWGSDGYAYIFQQGERFTVLAKLAPLSAYDERNPPLEAQKPLHITRLTGSQWARITSADTGLAPDENPVGTPQEDPLSAHESDGNTDDRDLAFLDNEIRYGNLIAMPHPDCKGPCVKEKVDDTCSALLATVRSLSIPDAITLKSYYDDTVMAALTKISLHTPEVEWDHLPLAARKMVDVTYMLRDQGLDMPRAVRLKFALTVYASPPAATSFNRIYSELQEQIIAAHPQDDTTLQSLRISPATFLLKQLLIDSPEKIAVFFSNFHEKNSTEGFKITLARLASSLGNSLWQYSAEQAANFLHDFDLDALLFPGSFDRVAWLYDDLRRQDAGQSRVYDPQNGLVQKRASLIRALGFEQAKPKLVPAVLRALGFNGMTLTGSYGLNLCDLSSRRELQEVIGVASFTYREKLALLEEVRSQTGISQHYLIGTPEAAVDKMLTLFPDGKYLAPVAQGNVDGLFNQLITVQLALEDGVTKADPVKLAAFWKNLLAQRPLIPGLMAWIDNLRQQYPAAILDCMVAAANGLYAIAKGTHDNSDSPIAPALYQFAKRTVRTQLRARVIGGSSPRSIAVLMQQFLTGYLGAMPAPTTIQGWADWLASRQSALVHPETRATARPRPKYSLAARDYAIQWLQSAETVTPLPGLFTNAADDFSARFNLPEASLLDDTGVLTRSHFVDLQTTLNNSRFTVIKAGIEGLILTTFKKDDAVYSDHFLGDKDFPYPQMLARDSFTGIYYANKLPKGTQGASLVVGGRRMDTVPGLALLLRLKDSLTDFSNRNGTEIFDAIFNVREADIRFPQPDARALFTTFYNDSWLYRAIVNAMIGHQSEKWTIHFGQAPYIGARLKFIFMPWHDQLQRLPKDFDLSGAPQKISVRRLYLQLWLDMFLQQKEPAFTNQHEQGASVMLANIILDQVGWLTYERWSFNQTAQPLALGQRLHQARIRGWENRFAMEVLKQIAPADARLAVFSANPAESMTLKPMLAEFTSLPDAPYIAPLWAAIDFEGGTHSNQYRSHFLDIYQHIFENKGIGAQLMTKYSERISEANRWRFVCVDRNANRQTFKPFGASHRIDHQNRIAYFADPTLFPSVYLSANGPVPLSFRRLVVQMMVQILLGTPDLEDADIGENRGPVIPFVDILLKEANYKTPTAIAAAITDPSDQNATLRLQNNALSTYRHASDENNHISDHFWAHYRFNRD